MAANITAKISLDSTQFTAGLAKATAALRGVSVAIGAAGLAASTAFGVGIKSALDYAGKISDAAARTGMAAGEIAVLQQAFQDAGLGADSVATTINKMQRSLFEASTGSKETAEAFQRLGLDVSEMMKLSPAEQFDRVAKAIGGVKDEAAASGLAMQIFGRSGAELKVYAKNPDALAQARKRVGGAAGILDKDADTMDNISDSFGAIGTKVRGFFLGAASALLPILDKLAGILDNVDLAGFGQRFGAALSTGINFIVQAFKQGKVLEVISLGLKIGFGEAINYLSGALLGVIDALGAAMGALFSAMLSGETLKPSFKIFLAIPEIIIGGIIAGMARVAAALQGAFTFAVSAMLNALPPSVRKFLTGSEKKTNLTLSDSIAEANKRFGGAADFGDKLITDALSRFGSAGLDIAKIGGKIGTAFLDEIKKISSIDMINTAEWKTQLASLAAQLNVPVATLEKASTQIAETALVDVPEKMKAGKGGMENQNEWARIGLFAGGGAGDALDYARQTADNTKQLVDVIVARWPSPSFVSTGARAG